jgi:hypothetical protein
MLNRFFVVLAAVLLTAGTAFAQEVGVGAGRMEVSAFPGGGIRFTESAKGVEPDFTNYAFGGSFTFNLNKWIGFEAEGGGTLGLRQTMVFNNAELAEQKTPDTWLYMGNVLLNPLGNDRRLVPYGTGGVGGLTLLNHDAEEIASLGVMKNETYLMGNVGGGLKWFATRHVGLRADYRFFMLKNKDTAPTFFGQENRYGHRVYGGLLFTY